MHHRHSERTYTRAVRAKTPKQAHRAIKGLSDVGVRQLLSHLDNGARERLTKLLRPAK